MAIKIPATTSTRPAGIPPKAVPIVPAIPQMTEPSLPPQPTTIPIILPNRPPAPFKILPANPFAEDKNGAKKPPNLPAIIITLSFSNINAICTVSILSLSVVKILSGSPKMPLPTLPSNDGIPINAPPIVDKTPHTP